MPIARLFCRRTVIVGILPPCHVSVLLLPSFIFVVFKILKNFISEYS